MNARPRHAEPKAVVPLSDDLAERTVIGACLVNSSIFWDLYGRLDTSHFATPRLAKVWEAMCDLARDNKPITRELIPMAIKRDVPDGMPLGTFLVMLMSDADQSIARDLADVVLQLAGRRSLIAALDQAKADVMAADLSTSSEEAQAMVLARVSKTSGSYDRYMKSLGEWAMEAANEINEAFQKGEDGAVGFSSGIRAVDEVWGRMMPGKLYVLGGLSGGGKSTLARQLTEAMAGQAAQRRLGFGYVASLEMGGKEHALRTLAQDLGLPASAMEENSLNLSDVERIYSAASTVGGRFPINIDTRPRMRASDIRARILRQKHHQGLSFVLIDHILLIRPSRDRDGLSERVSEAVQDAKDLAKEFDVPVIMLAQLDEKRVMERPSGRPIVQDIFGSQMVKFMADAVGFIHRPEVVEKGREPSTRDEQKHAAWSQTMANIAGKAVFFNDKRRGGKGQVTRNLLFDGPTMTFRDV
ncbi:DnaB-like helicase C-terminal domain-containing protein [Prosthecomicrobium hirschii]|uniref:DnaB-like helicase C-terminal domain-containing protein n=1 Tax=Prosthecodimorpha hirschii TaxID=665126 RepID=UPI00221F0236|nr:DnaB-like helicase C-terminal domain-containing protein [Prosthecomicrobium hirschii]MCW1844159.1 hypothetical protein [Prosthecomicrobium hirschii]